MRILLGFDGSEAAALVIADDLDRAGLPAACDVVVLTTLDAWLPRESESTDAVLPAFKAHREAVAAELERLRLLAQAEGDRLGRRHPQWRTTVEVLADQPAWSIIRRAEQPLSESDRRPFDLIVIGSRGHGGLKRLLLGSVSHKVVSEVRRSVRIARGPTRPAASPPRIVVGVDGSKHALAAIDAIGQRVWPKGTEVRVVAFEPILDAAVAYGPVWGGDPLGAEPIVGALGEDVDLGGNRIAGQAADRLRIANPQVTVTSVVRKGDPKYGLVAEAQDWKDGGADCIVVGAQGARGIERFVLGSVSTYVAMHAACSVEIVHRSAESQC